MQSLNATISIARKNFEHSMGLLIMLTILSKFGSKFFTNFSLTRPIIMQKAQYFVLKLVEMIISEIHDRFSHTDLFDLLRKIQILSVSHSCLFDLRNAIFIQYCHQTSDYLQAMKFVTDHFKIEPLSEMLKNYPQLFTCFLEIGQHSKILVDRKLRLFMNYYFLFPEFNRSCVNRILTTSHSPLDPERDIFNWLEKSIEQSFSLPTQISSIVFPLNVNPNETLAERALQEYYTQFEKQVKDVIAVNHEMIELELMNKNNNNIENQESTIPMKDIHSQHVHFDDILEDLSNVCEVFIVPSSDSEFLTNHPEMIRNMMLESLPIILFDILHPFPDSINQWASFIIQQLLSYLRSPECTIYLSRFFTNEMDTKVTPSILRMISHDDDLPHEKENSTPLKNSEICILLATYCCRYLFKTIQDKALKLCERIFEMCLVVEGSLFSQYRFFTKFNVKSSTIQNTIKKNCESIKESLLWNNNDDDRNAAIDILTLMKEQHFKEESQMSQLLKLFSIADEKDLSHLLNRAFHQLNIHIIEDRLLNYHLNMFSMNDNLDFLEMDQSIPIVKTLEMVGLEHSKKNLLSAIAWKQNSFFELDFEEYADILQEVIQVARNESMTMLGQTGTKTITEKVTDQGDNHTLILLYLHQVVLILGNYPFHKLLTSNLTEDRVQHDSTHNKVPYLHPIMHSSVLSSIASNPLVEMGVKELHSHHKLRLGKLFDDLVRKCHLARFEAQTQLREQMKKDLFESSHEIINVKNEVDQMNRSMLEKLLACATSMKSKEKVLQAEEMSHEKVNDE